MVSNGGRDEARKFQTAESHNLFRAKPDLKTKPAWLPWCANQFRSILNMTGDVSIDLYLQMPTALFRQTSSGPRWWQRLLKAERYFVNWKWEHCTSVTEWGYPWSNFPTKIRKQMRKGRVWRISDRYVLQYLVCLIHCIWDLFECFILSLCYRFL